MAPRRLTLRREPLAALGPAELARVAGGVPPTWYDCLSVQRPCEPLIDWETWFCPTES